MVGGALAFVETFEVCLDPSSSSIAVVRRVLH
jgi:hypothetical protein